MTTTTTEKHETLRRPLTPAYAARKAAQAMKSTEKKSAPSYSHS